MNLYVGTSGYSYKEWKGSFYPEKLPAKQMLAYYGEHFRTVEINYTFKRLPTAAVLKTWTAHLRLTGSPDSELDISTLPHPTPWTEDRSILAALTVLGFYRPNNRLRR
jgi:Protein of unknown function DUF72